MVAVKNVTYKLGDVRQLAQIFSIVIEEEWTAICRHTKAVEEENMSRK
jgi:hypothetical protein